jgi:filamentous hemagglutinin family protein
MNQPRTTRRPVTQRRHFALHPLSLALMLGFTGTAGALPNAGTVVSGQVTIQNPSANLQVVTQTSQRGIVDWKSFSIGSGQTVRFNQPSSSAVLLNRVTGYDPSQILGQMQANGRIFLLNPHGIVFGASARVDVGGMVASTLSLSNADFNAGRYQLTSAGGRGALRNDGVITADGGTVALVAPKVTNTGTIEADGGRVGLAAADSVLVDVEGDGLVFFNASATGMQNRLEHLGRIQADGGTVQMRAAARAAMVDTVLNLSGVVQARSLGMREGQVVIDGGARGITAVHGTIDASGRDAGESGGTVKVLGQMVGLFGNTSIDAAGAAGGGTVLVGGNYQGRGSERNALRTFVSGGTEIDVSATATGDGGTAVVWSDDVTRYHGKVSARGGSAGGDGGLIEVSGKQTLVFRGAADLTAPRGKGGTLLLDPQDIILVADSVAGAETDLIGATNNDSVATTYAFDEDTGENITLRASSLNGIGGASTIVLQAERDVIFDTNLTFTTANKGLSIQARNDINLNGNTITTNGGAITLAANFDNAGGGSIVGSGFLNASATAGAATLGGAITLTAPGTGAIAVGGIISNGRAGAAGAQGADGSNGGQVQITAGSGGISIGAAGIAALGGAGGASTDDNNTGGAGGVGGAVTLASATGGVTFAVGGAIVTTGGTGGLSGTNSNDDGGAGGTGGAVIITAGAGGVSFDGAGIAAQGGTGGAARTGSDNGGQGGGGGTITINSAGPVSFANGGAVTARGGTGGAGGGGAGGPRAAGAAAAAGGTGDAGGAGGDSAVIAITSSAASVQVAAVSSNGGSGGLDDPADTAGGTGASGEGADINLSAATNLTVTGALNAGTISGGTNADIRLTFATDDGAGRTLDISAAGFAATAEVVTATGGAGLSDTIIASSNAASMTLTDASLTRTGQTAIGIAGASIEVAVLSGGTGANDITLSGWSGTAQVLVTAGDDTITGNGAGTTLVAPASGATFVVSELNGGSVTTASPGTTTFTGIANLLGAAGNDTFEMGLDGSIASVDGAGGTNTLDLSDKTADFVSINLQLGTINQGGVGAYANITSFVGNGTDTRLTGRNIATTYTVSGTNTGSITNADGTITFSGVTRLIGGTNDDVFAFGNNALLRSIDGGTGTDTLTYATRGGAVTINLQATDLSTGFVATAAGFTGIETLVGNQDVVVGAATTLVGATAGATFNVTALNEGTVGTLAFSGVGSLQGGTGADSYVFTGAGALAGSLTDTGGATTLSGAVATGTTQSYAGDVTLGTAVVTVSSAGAGVNGAITFSGAVDATTAGVEALVVETQGTTTFTGNIGANQRLASISTDAGGTTALPAQVRTVGDQNFADAATGTTVTLDASGAAALTLGVGSDLDTLNVTVGGAATLVVNDADALTIGTLTLGGGTASFTVANSILRTTPLTLGGATLTINVGGGADVDATVANVFASASPNYTEVEISAGATAAADNLRIEGSGILEGVIVSGNLVVNATGPISQTGALVVTGTSSFTAIGQGVDLNTPTNNFGGAVSVNVGAASAGNVTVRDTNALELGNLTLGTGSLLLVAGQNVSGDLTQAPGTSVIQAPGAAGATLAALNGGSVAVTNLTNDFTGVVVLFGSGDSVGVADVNDLTVDLSFFPNNANTGLTAIAGAGGVTGNLNLIGTVLPLNLNTGTGDINLQSRAGALTLGIGSTLQTTDGNITLASVGDLNVQGISTGSGDLTFEAIGGNVNLLQNITTGGDLTITTSGNISAGGVSLNIGGAFGGSAGGSILVNGNFGGLNALTAGTFIDVSDNTGGLNINGNISAGGYVYIYSGDAAGGITLTGDVSAGSSVYMYTGGVFSSPNTAVTAGTSVFLMGNSGLAIAAGSVDAATVVDLRGGNGLLDFGTATLSGVGVTLVGSGVTGDGSVDAGSGVVLVNALDGAIELNGSVTTTNATASAVRLINASSVDVDTVSALNGGVVFGEGGGFALEVGNVSVGTAIIANTVSGVSTGDVLLGSGTQIDNLGALSASGLITVVDGGALTLTGNVTAGGALNIGTSGALSLQAFSATGQGVTLTAQGISSTAGSVINGLGGDVLLDAQGQNLLLGGTVQTTSGTVDALTIRDAATVTLGGLSTGAAGTTTIGVGTDITGNVTLGGTALLSTGTLVVSTDGAVNLFSTNVSNNVATLGSVETTGAFSLRDANGGLAIAGAVDTNGGSVQIVSTGAVSMTGSIDGNDVTLTGSSVTLQGGNVLGGAGGVALTATGGNVTQTSGTINTAGTLELSATGSVTLNNAVTVGSLGASTVTGDLLLRQNGDLSISGAVQVGGTFTLEAIGGGVDQSAVLTVGTLAVTAAQDVDLTTGANSFGAFAGVSSGGFVHIVDGDLTGLSLVGAVSGTDVELQTSGLLTLGSNNVTATAGAIDLTSVGLTGSGTIGATGGGVTITAGGGNVTLTGGTLTADAGTISVLNAGTVALGTVDAGGGSVVLGASGSVSQSGTLTAGSLTGLVTGGVVLDQNNAVGTLGGFTAGSLVLNDLGGLTITGPVTTTLGGLDIRTTGALVLDGATVGSAGTLVLVGTSLEQTAGSVTAAGASTLDGGAGGIDLASDTNSFGGTVTLQRTGGAVNLHASGALFVGSLDAVADQPVELVAATNLTLVTGGLLDIGSADLTLEATAGNLAISGNIIANVLDITAGGTISLAGNITTTGDQTYAGAVLFTGDVTMDAGASKIALQGGATGAGGNLTLVSDNTDADAISTGAAIDSIGQFTVEGNITLGGDVLGSGAQLYGGAVVLSAATVTLSAGTGNVTFTSTVDGTVSGAQSLVVTTSGITRFDGVVGTGVALGNLTTDGGGSTVLAGAGGSGTPFVTTIGNQIYGDPLDPEVTAIESDTLLRGNQVTFNGLFNANGFEIAFQVAQETVFGGGVTGGGRIVLSALDPADSIGLAGAAGDLLISQATLNNLAGFGTIVIGAVDFSGDVQSNNVVLPTNLEVRTTAGTVDFNGTVLSDGTARDLTVNAGGLTTFGAAVGNTGAGALGTITVGGNTEIGATSVRSTGAQSYGGNLTVTTGTTLAGSAIDIDGTLTAGANNLTLLADAIDVNAVGVATGTVRLGGSTAATAIGIATADIAGRLDLSQALLNAFANATDLVIGRVDGTAGITANAFTLTTDTRIESDSGNVTLNGAVNSAGGSNHDLEIATAGLTTLGGAVGATQALGAFTIEGASRLNGGSVTTTGAQNYEGAAVFGAATTLTGPTVAFGGSVDGAFALTVNAATTNFGGAVGAGTALASLTTNAAGTTTLGGDVSTTGAQTYNDAVALGANAVLTGSRVTLAGTVNGARTLQIDAAGGVTLGDTVALTSLLVNGPTTIGGTEVSTTGVQRYNGTVTLTAGATTLVGSALTFSSTVNGTTDLVLQSNGTTTFGGNVGGTTALRSIDSQGDGDVVLLGDSIRTTGAQSYAGALQVDGNTTLTGGTLLFASGLSGAANLTLRTDALAAQAPITGTGVLTIAPLSQGTTIGLAGGAGDLQITQAILNGADDFSRLVIGRADGTGAINAGNLRLFDDTRILSRTGDIRLNGSVDGAVNLALDTGGTTRIAGPVGSQEALRSLTTDNNPNVADWDGTSGERTLFDAGGGRAVVATEGDQTYNDPVVTTVPVTLSAANVVAAQTGNRFGAAVNLNAQTVTLRSGESIDLGDVTLTNGGTVETGGVLRLSGALRLEGGTLVLTSLATPTALDEFTDEELAEKAANGLVVNGKPVVEASAAIDQDATASTVSTASGSLLVLRASGGGSINLLGDNALLGEISAVSGRLGDTDQARFQGAGAVTIGFVRLNSTEINVAGAPPADGDQTVQRAGIESDAVWLRADKLFTGPEGLIRARLPFNNFLDGSARSVPGITLFMSEVALAEGGGFGSSASDTWIQVSIGDAAGGFLTVRPKGENGPNAFILLAGDVDARPFYDGAGQITEVRVFYNGDTPRTAQEQGALSAVQALAEDARQSRFEEAVRTENVRQRLRSGVIAEVGAGRPATVGRESIKLPENCEPKAKSLECQ